MPVHPQERPQEGHRHLGRGREGDGGGGDPSLPKATWSLSHRPRATRNDQRGQWPALCGGHVMTSPSALAGPDPMVLGAVV